MKVRGDRQPPGAFTAEKMPNKPGYVMVRLYENARAHEGEESAGWEYDEYRLILPDAPGLEMQIMEAYGAYMAEAKLQEPGPAPDEINRADIDFLALMVGVDL